MISIWVRILMWLINLPEVVVICYLLVNYVSPLNGYYDSQKLYSIIEYPKEMKATKCCYVSSLQYQFFRGFLTFLFSQIDSVISISF